MPVNAFLRFLNQLHPIKSSLENYLLEKISTVSFNKGKFLISPLDKEDCVFFLVRGAVRGFTKIGQKKITTWLTIENNLVGRIRQDDHGEVVEEYIEALEYCEVVKINSTFLKELYSQYFEINYIGRLLAQKLYMAAEERALIGRLPTAEAKYKRFLSVYPDLINRVSLKYIAFFLGLSVETLSRIRAKITTDDNELIVR